jgi:tetratricopeptide (TPR) repeat protein
MAAEDRHLDFEQGVALAYRLFDGRREADAERFCRELLKLRPDDGRVLNLLGRCQMGRGAAREAAETYRAALQSAPHDLDLRMSLGQACEALDDDDAAIRHYRSVVETDPDRAQAWHRLGVALGRCARREDASEALARACALAPHDSHARHDYAKVLVELGRHDAAEAEFAAAAQADPANPAPRQGRGVALIELRRYDEAVDVLEALVGEHPDFVVGLVALGTALRFHGRLDEARRHLGRAVGLRSDSPEALVGLGIIERKLGHYDDALHLFDQAIEVRPDDVATNYNRARLLILLGRLDEGYGAYDRWRWAFYARETGPRLERTRRPFAMPYWDGDAVRDKHILVWGEQGVGDEIMYAGMLDRLVDAGARLTVECDPRLVSLFRRSFPSMRVVSRTNPPNGSLVADDIDVQVPMLSLCRWLHPQPADSKRHGSYLRPDPGRTRTLRAKYGEGDGDLLVGFSWLSGNRNVGQERSVDLESWLPLFRQSGCRFINLQYGDHSAEIGAFNDRHALAIIDDPTIDPLVDLDAFAAQVAAMDLTISIDNTTVHMAGALGRPVWTVLPLSPDPRWLASGETTPWYDTMRLFRQDSVGDWRGVFGRVASALESELRSRPPRASG